MTHALRGKMAAAIALLMAAGLVAGCHRHPGYNSDWHGGHHRHHHDHDGY